MEAVFFGVVGYFLGWLSTGLVLWTLGLLGLFIYSIGLIFTHPEHAKISLPMHLLFLAIASLLCWGDYILIGWMGENWPTAKTGMMIGAIFPGILMLGMPAKMLRGAKDVSGTL